MPAVAGVSAARPRVLFQHSNGKSVTSFVSSAHKDFHPGLSCRHRRRRSGSSLRAESERRPGAPSHAAAGWHRDQCGLRVGGHLWIIAGGARRCMRLHLSVSTCRAARGAGTDTCRRQGEESGLEVDRCWAGTSSLRSTWSTSVNYPTFSQTYYCARGGAPARRQR